MGVVEKKDSTMEEYARINELRAELRSFDPEAHFDKLRSAKQILLVISCCDARVGGKTEHDHGVMIDWIPNIGGVLPKKEELKTILDTLTEKGIDLSKVTILANAHGSHQELAERTNPNLAPACGARAVAKAVAEGGDKHEIAHHHDVADLTVQIAASRPGLFTMGDSVAADIQSLEALVAELGVPVSVGGSYFDNNAQVLEIVGVDKLYRLKTHDQEWEHSHQDPKRFVLSVGEVMSIASIETQFTGAQTIPGFAFDSEAAITPEMARRKDPAARAIVMEALAMIDYAVSNALQNFGATGKNFANPEMVLIRADSEVEYNFLMEVLKSQDTNAMKILGHLKKLRDEKGVGIFVQLLKGSDGKKEVRKVSLAVAA